MPSRRCIQSSRSAVIFGLGQALADREVLVDLEWTRAATASESLLLAVFLRAGKPPVRGRRSICGRCPDFPLSLGRRNEHSA